MRRCTLKALTFRRSLCCSKSVSCFLLHTVLFIWLHNLLCVFRHSLRCVFRHSLLYILIHTLRTLSSDAHLLYMFTVYILILAYTLYCKRQIPGKQSPHVDGFVQFLGSKDGQKDAIVSINQDQWRSFVQFSKQVLSL
jgi:hypothetical protein